MTRRITALIGLSLLISACGEKAPTPPPAAKPTSPATAPAAAPLTPMQRGAKLYKRCQACHTLEDGGKHKVGPNLWAVYGSKAGSKDGYAYSKAMLASGVTWDDETMDGYITKPRDFMPGNKMSFIGIKKAEDRDALQLYIKAQTGG